MGGLVGWLVLNWFNSVPSDFSFKRTVVVGPELGGNLNLVC